MWTLILCYTACTSVNMIDEESCVKAQKYFQDERVISYCINRRTGNVLSMYL